MRTSLPSLSMLDQELADTLYSEIRGRRLRSLNKRRRVTETGCWEWTGARLSNGYGSYRTVHSNLLVHRVAYELLVGPIPDGNHIHHRCENIICFNPDHLQPLPQGEHTILHHRLDACTKCGGTNRAQGVYRGRPNGWYCRDCKNAKRRKSRCIFCGTFVPPGSTVCAAHEDLLELDAGTSAVVSMSTQSNGRSPHSSVGKRAVSGRGGEG